MDYRLCNVNSQEIFLNLSKTFWTGEYNLSTITIDKEILGKRQLPMSFFIKWESV